MDALGKLVSAEVRAMAGRKRWSAAALARELGWAQSYMARRWDGRAALTPAEVAAIARVLGVPMDALLPTEAREVREVAGPEVLAALDLDQLERIAAALGVSVASLIPQREAVAGGSGPAESAGTGRVLRFKPDDPARDSTYYRPATKELQVKAASILTSGRSAESTRPPSVTKSDLASRSTGPGSRRPRVSARLAGNRS